METPKKNKRYSYLIKLLWVIISLPIISIFLIFYLISEGYMGYIPSFEELENPKNNLATQIISSDQQILGVYFKENRSNINYDDLSPNVTNALLATEDIRFNEHSGIDLIAIGRAIYGALTFNLKGGGSTITQQLSKLLYHNVARGVFDRILQKLNEWVISVKLEKRYTKKEIMTMYLNKFDFLNLAVGIKSAAKVYFNSTPDTLKIEQAAMLVGMAKNPALFNPLRREKLTLDRRNVVLSQMLRYDFISRTEYDSLSQIPLNINFQKVDHKLGMATYFREFLRITLNARKPIRKAFYSEQQYKDALWKWNNDPLYGWRRKNPKSDGSLYNLYSDGLKIHTTLNYKMQKYAEEAVTVHLKKSLQKDFFKEQEGRKKAPFAWNVSEKEISSIMNATMRRSERYRAHKYAGMSKDSIIAKFHEPVKMSVFSWDGDIDTIMTPYDSIRYYKYYLRSGFMSMDPHTGFVKAYVGGINYKHFQYDHVSVGRRQVGSTFKPFIYTLAMQNGYSPCYKVPNVPVTFMMPEGQPPYTPKITTAKFLEKYEGKMITLKTGLAHSMNQISAKVLKMFTSPGTYNTGAQAAIKIARSMGVRSPMQAYPSICVGIPEVLLSEMVGAYCTFANKGVHTEPLFVTRIEDKNGNIISNFSAKINESIDEESAYLMLSLMQGVVNYGTSVRLKYKYKFKADIAGKTGTTNNHSDGWFMGITPNLVSGTWVGGEERSVHFRGIGKGQGANMALPIWAEYMKRVYADSTLNYHEETKFQKPARGLSVEIDCDKFDKILEAEEEEEVY